MADEVGEHFAQLMKAPAGVAPEEIMEAVESVMTTIEGDLSAANLKFYAEIESLSSFINSARSEIAALRPQDITEEHLPAATDELEAIVGATEQATNAIFEAVELIEGLAAEMPPEISEKITGAVTSVYEACGFQVGRWVADEVGEHFAQLMKAPAGVAPEEIMEAVESVMTTIEGDLSAANLKFYAEIESLSSFINSARSEIAALRPQDITEEHGFHDL